MIMTDMIFDLIENCDNILAGKGYLAKKHNNYEQSAFIKYLIEQGLTLDNVKDIWYKTKQEEFEGVEDVIVDAVFKRLLSKSRNILLIKREPIKIYSGEIEFLNNLNVYMWEKQYFLILLCVYKYYGREWLETSKRLRQFCFSVTDAKHERDRHSEILCKDRIKYKVYDVNSRADKKDRSVTSIKVTMPMDVGEVVAEIPNPRYIDEKILGLLTCTHVCSQCGAIYEYTPKGIDVFLCPKCYKKERNRKANSYKIQQT